MKMLMNYLSEELQLCVHLGKIMVDTLCSKQIVVMSAFELSTSCDKSYCHLENDPKFVVSSFE